MSDIIRLKDRRGNDVYAMSHSDGVKVRGGGMLTDVLGMEVSVDSRAVKGIGSGTAAWTTLVDEAGTEIVLGDAGTRYRFTVHVGDGISYVPNTGSFFWTLGCLKDGVGTTIDEKTMGAGQAGYTVSDDIVVDYVVTESTAGAVLRFRIRIATGRSVYLTVQHGAMPSSIGGRIGKLELSDFGGQIDALSSQRMADLVNLVEQLGESGSLSELFPYTLYQGYKPTYDAETNTLSFATTSDTKYRAYVMPVRKGVVYRRVASSSVNRTVYVGYTQNEIASGDDLVGTTFEHVTGEVARMSFDTVSVAPYDGLMVLYLYVQDWVSGSTVNSKLDLSVLKEDVKVEADGEEQTVNATAGQFLRVSNGKIVANSGTGWRVTDLIDVEGHFKINIYATLTTSDDNYDNLYGGVFYSDEEGTQLIASPKHVITLASSESNGWLSLEVPGNAKTFRIQLNRSTIYTNNTTRYYFTEMVVIGDAIRSIYTKTDAIKSVEARVAGLESAVGEYPSADVLVGVVDELEEVPLRGSTAYAPTYCPGNIASKRNGNSGNSKRMCNLSPIYAKKGDKVRIVPNEELLGEGEHFSCGFYETDLSTPLTVTGNLAAAHKLRGVEPSATQNTMSYTVQQDACTMVYVVCTKWSGSTELSLQGVDYEAGELFTVEVTNVDAVDYRLEALESGMGGGTDVVSVHGRQETLFRLENLRENGLTSSVLTPGRLNFIHFSDIHQGQAQAGNLARIMDYFNEYAAYLDFVLNTGDFVPDAFAQYSGGACSKQSSAIRLAENKGYDMGKVLNVMGNHDTALKNPPYTNPYGSGSSYDWTRYCGRGPEEGEEGYFGSEGCAYDRYIKPYAEAWEALAKPAGSPAVTLVQPEDAETEGKCYYYKDFYRGMNSGSGVSYFVRLVVVDVMELEMLSAVRGESLADCGQMVWLREVLDASLDADNKNYTVVLASHYGALTERVGCPFTTLHTDSLANGKAAYVGPVLDAVGGFVAQGGHFAFMLAGHIHYDLFGIYSYVSGGVTYRLPVLRVDTASAVGQAGDRYMPHRTSDKSWDLFNVVSIDPYRKRWCVFRVGADLDSMMRHIGSMTYYYGDLTRDNNVLASW